MKTAADKKTPDLLPDHDLAGERIPKPTSRELARARAARFKERHNVAALTVNIDAAVLAAFEAWFENRIKDREMTKAQVIEKLIKQQLLRKR
jgi:hypothetical protein